ncbi:hypothetical protein A2U01_0117718, partial [Trifolium medium]|nr:hypothetical protein [Trifolium medium]
MFKFKARPEMMMHQVKRTDPAESGIMPHQAVGLTRHRRQTAEGGVPHNLDPKHPEHGSDA